MGLELEGLEAAKAEAKKPLPDIAKDKTTDGYGPDFGVVVVDGARQEVLWVTLSLLEESLS